MPERIAVVTPWYPTSDRPFNGSFVQGFAETVVRHVPAGVDVLHLEAWGLPRGPRAQRRCRADLARLVRDPIAMPSGELAVRHLPVPSTPGIDFGPLADGHRTFIRQVAKGRKLPHAVVHAHVGLTGGLPALDLLRSTSRFFVTEHAGFLDRIFRDPNARRDYGVVIERAEAVLCVSELLRDRIVKEFPSIGDRVFVVPNPIDFDAVPARRRLSMVPRRWLYVGALTERKGVRRLIESFVLAHEVFPDITLKLVGEGPERQVMEARIQEVGLTSAVTWRGAVAPSEMPSIYASSDLLVHLSASETFGMTLVEAVAAGIPVIATRCGGPLETIGPVDGAVGRLLPVICSAQQVASAYDDIRHRRTGTALEEGRLDLRSRYGREAVGRRLRRLYDFGGEG